MLKQAFAIAALASGAQAAEEAFVYLLESAGESIQDLELRIRADAERAEIEIRCADSGVNLETLTREVEETTDSDVIGLRVLKHMTDELKHQQFRNGEFLVLGLKRRATPSARLN